MEWLWEAEGRCRGSGHPKPSFGTLKLEELGLSPKGDVNKSGQILCPAERKKKKKKKNSGERQAFPTGQF